MPDRLHALLNAEADRRVAGEAVPPVSSVGVRRVAGEGVPTASSVRVRRVSGRRSSGLRIAGPMLAAAAAVVAIVLVAGQLAGPRPPSKLVIETPPQLGAVAPAAAAATRLGAPPGHVNGPAVTTGDLLAVSPSALDGQRLRMVGAVRDSTRAGLVDRCTAVTTEPAGTLLDSSCDWSLKPDLNRLNRLSVDPHGPGERTWLSGTAPNGTAAVLLRPDGREQVQVPTAPGKGRWGESVHWVAWGPVEAADVVAVNANGAELAHTRLPSTTVREAGAGDPEQGTIETPTQVRQFAEFMPDQSRFGRPGLRVPDRVDVLAREQVEPGVTVYLVGYTDGKQQCTVSYVVDTTLTDLNGGGGGGGGCGSMGPSGSPLVSLPGGPAFGLGRSFVAGSGRPSEQLLTALLPRGTTRLRLSAPGVGAKVVLAHDAGSRWGHVSYALTAWPSKPETMGKALAADGSVIATSADDGLDERNWDPKVLEAQSRCLERAGIKVERLQGGAYSWNVQGKEALAKQCLVRAKAQVPAPATTPR